MTLSGIFRQAYTLGRGIIMFTCNLVLITSAGVTSEAAGIPAMVPATNSDQGQNKKDKTKQFMSQKISEK